jgi:hypothetical protein
MEESEITLAVETWLKETSFQDTIIKEGTFMTGQSFGNLVAVQIDTRDGAISGTTLYQNQYNNHDSFMVNLISVPEIQADDADICEGNEMFVEITKEKFLEVLETFDLEYSLENGRVVKTDDGLLRFSWWEISTEVEISAETFVENFMEQDWEEWKENYARWSMEDLGKNWEDNVTEYYRGLREQREQEKIEEEL